MRYNREALEIYNDNKGALVTLEISDEKGTKTMMAAFPYDLAKELDATYDRLIRTAEERRKAGQWP